MFYDKCELIDLVNQCIREMRSYGSIDSPDNKYGYSEYLAFYELNLRPFRELNELVRDMIDDNEIITVAEPSAAANVFTYISFLLRFRSYKRRAYKCLLSAYIIVICRKMPNFFTSKLG